MVKKKVIIKGGKVHDVGYRLFLMNLAGKLEIERFDADNILANGKQCVEVLVESSENKIKKFFDIINKKENYPDHADADSADIEDYNAEIQSLGSFRSAFVAYQQQKFVGAAVELVKEVKEFRMESGEKQDKTIEEIKTVGEKVETVGEKVDTVGKKVDTVGKKVETVGEKVDTVGKKVETVGKKVDTVGEKVDTVGKKVDTLTNITRGVGDKVDNLTTTTQDNFSTINTKYDVISLSMNNILIELVKEREERVKERKQFRISVQEQQKRSDEHIEKLVNAILATKK